MRRIERQRHKMLYIKKYFLIRCCIMTFYLFQFVNGSIYYMKSVMRGLCIDVKQLL